MTIPLKRAWNLVKATGQRFADDNCPRMAAALAYYAVFSLPPLLVIVIAIVGTLFDPADVRGKVQQEVRRFLGPTAAGQIETMIEEADRPEGSIPATVIGVGVLVFAATGALAQLQEALNKVWRVEPDPDRGGIRNYVVKRLLSFAMILVVAFLLLVSLVLSALLSAFGDLVGEWLSGGVTGTALQLLHQGISLLVITLLFASLFKVLPDAEIAWRDVGIGAAFTAGLFVLGKFLFGLYLGNSNIGSAYGIAGSLALVLVWIYYSSVILFVGAEFTWMWSNRFGTETRPARGAVHCVEVRKRVRDERDEEQLAAFSNGSPETEHTRS